MHTGSPLNVGNLPAIGAWLGTTSPHDRRVARRTCVTSCTVTTTATTTTTTDIDDDRNDLILITRASATIVLAATGRPLASNATTPTNSALTGSTGSTATELDNRRRRRHRAVGWGWRGWRRDAKVVRDDRGIASSAIVVVVVVVLGVDGGRGRGRGGGTAVRGTHHKAVVLEDVHLAHRTGAVLQQPRVDAGLVELVPVGDLGREEEVLVTWF